MSSHVPPSPAVTKLHLKASAEKVGLDAGTTGWTILDRLTTPTSASDEAEWNDIWTALSTGLYALLLPLDASPPHEEVNAGFVKHHVMLRDGQQFITLSGMRGLVFGDVLTVRTTLGTQTKSFAILNSAASSRGMGVTTTFPPLSIGVGSSRYPSFSLPAYTNSLLLPARPPPRLGFASLFGHRPQPPIHVPAYTVANTLHLPSIASELNVALQSELSSHLALRSPSAPNDDEDDDDEDKWVEKRVLDWTSGFFPFLGEKEPRVNDVEESPEDLADILAGFYEGLESELDERKEGRKSVKVSPVEIMRRVEKGVMDVFFDRWVCLSFFRLDLYLLMMVD
jgi:hypothetical protein